MAATRRIEPLAGTVVDVMHSKPDIQVLKSAVLVACRAPSVHNSQPWRWVYEDATLKLFLDPHRRGRDADRSRRGAIISCGVVLDHLRVAMAAGGWEAQIDRLPDPNDPGHLA